MFGGLIERVRFLLDHRWSPGQMSAYLDGELSESGRGRIERHVHDCHRCRELLRGLRATIAALRGIGTGEDANEEADVAPRVLAGFRERVGGGGDDDGEFD